MSPAGVRWGAEDAAEEAFAVGNSVHTQTPPQWRMPPGMPTQTVNTSTPTSVSSLPNNHMRGRQPAGDPRCRPRIGHVHTSVVTHTVCTRTHSPAQPHAPPSCTNLLERHVEVHANEDPLAGQGQGVQAELGQRGTLALEGTTDRRHSLKRGGVTSILTASLECTFWSDSFE